MSSASTHLGASPSSVPATQPATSSPLAPADAPPKSTSSPISETPQSSNLQRSNSTPIDPSQLNNSPAPIPIPGASGADAEHSPLRTSEGPSDSAYLDANTGGEPSSHPTVAETGSLVRSPSTEHGGPGPKRGQLERKERKQGEGIIKLGSFGGEGLIAKPVGGLKMGDEEAVE